MAGKRANQRGSVRPTVMTSLGAKRIARISHDRNREEVGKINVDLGRAGPLASRATLPGRAALPRDRQWRSGVPVGFSLQPARDFRGVLPRAGIRLPGAPLLPRPSGRPSQPQFFSTPLYFSRLHPTLNEVRAPGGSLPGDSLPAGPGGSRRTQGRRPPAVPVRRVFCVAPPHQAGPDLSQSTEPRGPFVGLLRAPGDRARAPGSTQCSFTGSRGILRHPARRANSRFGSIARRSGKPVVWSSTMTGSAQKPYRWRETCR